MVNFENYERRIDKIEKVMSEHGIKDLEDARQICVDRGFDPLELVRGVQRICFDDACWAYTLGAVSYTHLDVYKRQEIKCAQLFC